MFLYVLLDVISIMLQIHLFSNAPEAHEKLRNAKLLQMLCLSCPVYGLPGIPILPASTREYRHIAVLIIALDKLCVHARTVDLFSCSCVRARAYVGVFVCSSMRMCPRDWPTARPTPLTNAEHAAHSKSKVLHGTSVARRDFIALQRGRTKLRTTEEPPPELSHYSTCHHHHPHPHSHTRCVETSTRTCKTAIAELPYL